MQILSTFWPTDQLSFPCIGMLTSASTNLDFSLLSPVKGQYVEEHREHLVCHRMAFISDNVEDALDAHQESFLNSHLRINSFLVIKIINVRFN